MTTIEQAGRHRLPSPCPVCGAYSLSPDARTSALLAVCDVLVLRALEHLGRMVVRSTAGRFHTLGSRPFHEAHTIWPTEEGQVDRVLRKAWDVIPAMVDNHGLGIVPGRVARMLDDYVRDLAITGTPHSIEELRYRFDAHLGLPVYTLPEGTAPEAAEDHG